MSEPYPCCEFDDDDPCPQASTGHELPCNGPYCKPKPITPAEQRVIHAAVKWWERIGDWPGAWGDHEDFEMIRAVQALTGVHTWDLDRLKDAPQ